VAQLNTDYEEFGPYLTSDLREIFFVSERGGGRDIWCAKRPGPSAPWGTPFPVAELNSSDQDTWPVVSADGLEIFFASHRNLEPTNGWNRVYRSTRPNRQAPWSQPVPVTELWPLQEQDNFSNPSYLSEDGLRIYTTRKISGDHGLYVSNRPSVGGVFSGPTPVPGDINTAASEAGAAISGDELLLVFGRHTGAWNLFLATRTASDAPFGVVREMTELNDPTCGTQPGYVSPGLRWIWFSSNRPGCPGPNDIFVAEIAEVQATPTPVGTPQATPTVPTVVNRSLWIFR